MHMCSMVSEHAAFACLRAVYGSAGPPLFKQSSFSLKVSLQRVFDVHVGLDGGWNRPSLTCVGRSAV